MRVAVAVGVVATGIALFQLFVPHRAGLADNGDYRRLLCHLHLVPDAPAGQQPVRYRQVYFTYHRDSTPSRPCDFQSPAIAPIWLASGISGALPGHHALDLGVVAVVYAAMFGLAVGALVAVIPGRPTVRRVTALLLLILLCDFAFTSYFASAYSEALAFVALIGAVGACVWYWRSTTGYGWPLAALTGAALVLILTKPQYGALALPLAIAVSARSPRLMTATRPLRGRTPAIVAGVVVFAAGILSVALTPRDFTKTNQYQVVFTSLLPHSPSPTDDLRDLGLPPQLARWSGTTGYEAKTASSDDAFDGFYDKTGVLSMATFYVSHPGRAVGLVSRGLRASADPRVDYLGKTANPSAPAGDTALCRFCVTSTMGRLVRPAAPVLIPLLWVGVVALATARLRSRRQDERAVAVTLLVTVGVAVAGFAAAVLGDGDYEVGKHLYLVDAANCLLVILLVPLAGQLLRGVRDGSLWPAGSGVEVGVTGSAEPLPRGRPRPSS